tara:strand:+ start:171 stop:371 length:201 start_codon:yes stop_codon:yes gene_type:complete
MKGFYSPYSEKALQNNELFITTASVGLNDIESERQPHAGKLFKFITQEQGYASNCYRSENTSNLYH